MKKLVFFILSVMLTQILQAQSSSGRFYGKIVDASTNKGIEAASVQLIFQKYDSTTQTSKDSLIDGMLTMGNGDFNMENVPLFSSITVLATAIGFETFQQKISINPKGRQGIDKDLGNIRLKIDPKMLQTVTVTGTRPLMSLGIDRKVFNVEKNITAAGGTAEDVMRSVPTLSVDIDGNVTLRNSSPQIFVDGRPTSLTLEQIPADAIESVEIITNPSAKFDASGGTAGILNIVLKKNRKTGYNGTLRAGIDQRGRYSFGADINVRQNKINFFVNANLRERKSISTGETDRLTFIQSPNTQLFQDDKNTSNRDNFFGRAGIDYLIDNRNTLSLSGNLIEGSSKNRAVSELLVDTLYSTGKRSSYSERLSNSNGDFKNRGAALGFKHLFARAGKEWTADINFNSSNNVNENNISTSTYNIIGGPLSKEFRQLIEGKGNNENLTVQTDYVDPITENSKLEFGGRIQIRNLNSRNDISYMSPGGLFLKVPQLSSQYSNTDKVYAGYATFSNKINNFGYQLGLRIESSEYSGDVLTAVLSGKDTAISYSNNFPLSFFPSIFLSKQLNNDQELQLNVTRRINRPNFFQLFPFTDYSDSLNLSRGNPNLKPEFTYSAELAYQKTFSGSNTFLASAYFKYTDQLITRYQEKEVNPVSGKENLINTFINARSSYIGGLELIHRQTMSKWWELTGNLNLFTSKINIDDQSVPDQDNIYSWSGELNNTFKLPANFSVQLSGEYRSKTILPPGGGGGGGGDRGGGGGGGGGGGWGQPQATSQGYIRPQWEIDAAVRYNFLQDKASITLNVSDIFRSDANNVYSESAYFRQNSYRLRDPQFFRLNFSWRFGKFDASLFKRKNQKNGEVEGPEEN
ncbi:MAG: outer membrane beta-barrel protein [Chitinophagaceae bacterium]